MSDSPSIFLSYSRADAAVADLLDTDFRHIGIQFRRDVRDVAYRADIRRFMQQIGTADYVVVLLSDAFLKSEWCMYEMTELLHTHRFHDKILPVVLESAFAIFKLKGRIPYYEYWKKQQEEHEQHVLAFPNTDTIEVVKRHRTIINQLDDFFQAIVNLNVLEFSLLKSQKYRPLLDLVGFDDKSLMAEIFAIWQITDSENRQLALQEFDERNPTNFLHRFARAHFEMEERRYKLAKKYFSDSLELKPDFASAHNDLGFLLFSHLNEPDAARSHLEKALELVPDFAGAAYNLGWLYHARYKAYDKAEAYYERALAIDPFYSKALNNLAILYSDHFKSPYEASRLYERSIALNPNFEEAEYNLGYLLHKQLADYPKARRHYERALDLKPDYAEAHENLAVLLKEQFADEALARHHYSLAVSYNPTIRSATGDAYFGLP